MAEFAFSEIDQNIEMMNHFVEINPTPNMNFQNILQGFSAENFTFPPQLGLNASSGQNFHASYNQDDEKNHFQVSDVVLNLEGSQTDNKKRKSMDLGESNSWNSSPHVSEDGVKTKNISRKGKRSKGNGDGDVDEKLKEVVHVRARRGQATDSHSLAERVRRGKINEKLKCLQDIVPGCYKTMGMAVMLDEIINYVQSLQNQVEFLSMKLTTASRFYDFNLDTDAIEAMQKANAYEEQKAQRILGEEFHHQGLINSTQFGSFDLTFGTYPSLPYTT